VSYISKRRERHDVSYISKRRERHNVP